MPIKRLTDLFCERAKPTHHEHRTAYFDAAFPSLALRVTSTGAKSFALFYRVKGRQRMVTLGKYPALRPQQARVEATKALELVRSGVDPAEEKRKRRDERDPEEDTFGALAELYLERHVKKENAASTYAEAKRDLERNVLPKWRRRPIASITDADVIDLIDGIAARGADSQARHTYARVRAFFNWVVVQRRRLKTSPMHGMKPPGKERERDRVLGDDELRWFWQAPVLARTRASKRLIFTTTGETQVSGFSPAKGRLAASMAKAKRQELGARKAGAIPQWTLHDLRRTAASGMARLRIAPHVIDRILAHKEGTIRGVARIYNRFEYLEERRDALEAWGRYVDHLVAPAPGSNVTELRRIANRGGSTPRAD
jgi:hypothetical protein